MTEFRGGIKLSVVNFSMVKFVFDFMLLMNSRGPELHAGVFRFSKLCWKQKLWLFLSRKLHFCRPFSHVWTCNTLNIRRIALQIRQKLKF